MGLCLFALLYRGKSNNTNDAHSPTPSTPQPLDPDDLVDAIERLRRDPTDGIRAELLLPGVPEGLVSLLRRMAAADPARRPSAQELKEEMRALVLQGALSSASTTVAGAACSSLLPRDDSMGLLMEREQQRQRQQQREGASATAAAITKGGRPPLPSPPQQPPSHHRRPPPPPLSAPVQLPPAVLQLSSQRMVGASPLPESGQGKEASSVRLRTAHQKKQPQQGSNCVLM